MKKARYLLVIISVVILTFSMSISNNLSQEAWEEAFDQRTEAVEEKIDQVEGELNQITINIQETIYKRRTLNEELSVVRDDIKKLDELITELKVEIASVENEIELNQRDIQSLSEQIKTTLQSIQKSDSKSTFEILLSSGNLSEIVNKISSLNRLQSKLEDISQELVSKNNELDANRTLLESTKTVQEQTLALSSSRKDQLDFLVLETEGEEAKYRELVSALEDQKNSFNVELKQIEESKVAEAQRIKAEQEARRLAELARIRAQNDSASSGGGTSFTSGFNPSYGTDPGGADWNYGGCVQETFATEGLEGINFVLPAAGYLTNGFGCVKNSSGGGAHDGVDIANSIGTPIYAFYSGVVDYTNYSNFGFGNQVVIKHTAPGGETFYSNYAHLNSISVNKGQSVSTGQSIGTMGTTGNSTGPHLHFSISDTTYEYTGNANCNPNYGRSFTLCFNPFSGPFQLYR